MTVNELIKQLKELPGDLQVILQIDPEGNGYDTIRGVEFCIADKDLEEVYNINTTAEETWWETEEEWETQKQKMKEVAVIFP